MPNELTSRQIRFLNEAKKQAPNKGDVCAVRKVGEAIGMSQVEAEDIARVLEREFGEVGYVKRISGSSSDGLGPGPRAVLTDKGRELSLQLAEDKAAERRARLWRIVALLSNGFWVLVVLLGAPLYEKYVERKFERLNSERAEQTPRAPTTDQP